jgi:glycine betaine/proline transport system permease protein
MIKGAPSRSTLIWLAILTTTLVLLALREALPWLITFPEEWSLPFVSYLNDGMAWTVEHFGAFFRSVSTALDIPMSAIRDLLNWLPWSVTVFLITVTAYVASGWKLAIFSLVALGYMLLVGLWAESMNSLALVAMSVPLAIIIGFGFGTLGFYYPRIERIIMSMLDVLQTVPAFAYLLPILLLFGFGAVVGLIASILFAFPPMVRNTLLGLKRVSPEVIESGLMSGATASQLFFQVRVPSALKQILLGINQTTMAAFSMVIIASIIGGSSDVGWEVLSAMRKARFGESLVAGIVIALMAMIMDRITAGFANKETVEVYNANATFFQRHRYLVIAAVGAVVLALISLAVPFLQSYPEAWEIDPSAPLNRGIDYIIVEYAPWIKLIKTWAFFFLMLPLKMGLEQTISPYSWGFEFTPTLKWLYAGLVLLAIVFAWLRRGPATAIVIALLSITFFFGMTKLPWPAVFLIMTFLAWRLAGLRLALVVLGGLAYLLLAGVWPQTMLSVYLCGLGIILSFAIGSTIGILASEFKSVSYFVRPINDTLQTMPLFVLLIPFVMIFKIGEFTALLAIIAYATVPAVRYSEHGLRNVSKEVVEAAECMGCTRWQLLWRVKLPLAMPEMMLGLNQTIMYGISMLVITALVGTSGLGQQVYIGLGDGDFGVGMTAGIGMAIIAIMADRLTQAWSAKRQAKIGMQAVQ